MDELDTAYEIVREYYEAVDVMVREDREGFARNYFADDAGLWLASVNGRIVGCIALRQLAHLARSGEIKRMYVRPEYRGKGISEALLKSLEDWASKHGCRTLYLDSKKDLIPAIRFYRRHGYQFCERYNENPQATIFMRKQLP